MEDIIEPRARVNGSALMQHIGKPVSILGTVINTNPNGTSVELKTSDSHLVSIKLMSPLDEPLSGVVEFHGTAQGKNVVASDFYVMFDDDFTKNFDMDQYNEAVTLVNTIQNPWTTS